MKTGKSLKWLTAAFLTAGIAGCSASSDTSADAANKNTEDPAKEEYSFVQVTDTPNTYGFVDAETDTFEVNTTKEEDGIASRIYKPESGNTLVVEFHGNGEGATEDESNNYSQIAANRQAATFLEPEVQEAFGGAYVLSFQSPDDWYHDHTEEVHQIIENVIKENNIDPERVFATGLSAGGLMTERMIATYPELFNGALIPCAAIAKNDTYVEGSEVLPDLGGNYEEEYDYLPEEGNDEIVGVIADKSLDAGDEKTKFETEDGTSYAKFKKMTDYDSYVKNYDQWIEKIAASDVPLYFVHAYQDPTIYYNWTERAVDGIKEYREANGLTSDVHAAFLDSTDPWPGHWAWVRTYNNDVEADGVKSIDWLTGLAAPVEGFTATALPESEVTEFEAEDGTVTYTLQAEVMDDGEKITKIVLNTKDMNIDESALNPDDFKITRSNYEKEEPIEVASIEKDENGNIVLTLETIEGVLNYNGTRNVIEPIRYEIESMELPVSSTK